MLSDRGALARRVHGWPGPVRRPVLTAMGAARGWWPSPLAVRLQRWRARNPVGFNEKVRHKMAFDRRRLLVELADKASAPAYAAARVNPRWIVPLLAVVDRAGDIPWETLPREYVVKVSHGSGGVVVVTDRADPTARLPEDPVGWARFVVRPEAVRRDLLIAHVDHWLRLRYGRGPGGPPEWVYSQITPHAVVQPYVESGSAVPRQVNVYCFHGRPRSVSVMDMDLAIRPVRESRFLDGEWAAAAGACDLGPSAFAELLAACRELAEGLDFVRLDWLLGVRGPVLAEFTHYPEGGMLRADGHARLGARACDRVLATYW